LLSGGESTHQTWVGPDGEQDQRCADSGRVRGLTPVRRDFENPRTSADSIWREFAVADGWLRFSLNSQFCLFNTTTSWTHTLRVSLPLDISSTITNSIRVQLSCTDQDNCNLRPMYDIYWHLTSWLETATVRRIIDLRIDMLMHVPTFG